jgi:Kef-type K+ transport system membrane component KefB
VSQALFVPAFFLAAGFLVDLRLIGGTLLHQPLLAAGVVTALFGGKFVAAWLTSRILGYPDDERRLMFALSLPQVAATLAVALVAYQTLDPSGHRLVDEPILNATIVLVVVSSVAGLVLTGRYTNRLRSG